MLILSLQSWAENPESLRRQNELADDTLLVEGNKSESRLLLAIQSDD